MDKYSSISFGNLIKLESESRVLLPNFQRDFVWNSEKQKKLLASFLIDIPIGSILLVEGEGGEYSTRKLCFEEPFTDSERTECSYLLDGQQRISTLKNVFTDLNGDIENWDDNLSQGKLYTLLKIRWFINLNPTENKELDLFGFEELYFDEKKLLEARPDDIYPYISSHSIYKGKKYQNKWYAPGYHDVVLEMKDSNKKNQINNIIADEASENFLIPLYSVSDESRKPLHRHVLDKMGQIQVDRLKSEVDDGQLKLIDFFSDEGNIEKMAQNPLKYNKEINQLWNKRVIQWITDVDNFLNNLFERQIARIRLTKDEINRAIFVFEELNRGGTDLSSFDLLVARYAINADKDDEGLKFNIIELIKNQIKIDSTLSSILEGKEWSGEYLNLLNDKNPPSKSFKNLFLNQLGLLNRVEGKLENHEKLNSSHIKERYVLDLSSENIIKYYESTSISLLRALLFLQVNCGLYDLNKLGYKLTVLPISYLFASDKIWKDEIAHKKILYWYWTALFSGTYREAQQPRTIRDLSKLYEWVVYKTDNPFLEAKDNIFNEKNYSDLDTLLMKTEEGVNSNLELALLQFMVSNRPYDLIKKEFFKSKKPPRVSAFDIGNPNKKYDCIEAYDKNPNIHHIFPLGMFTKLNQSTSEIRYGHNVLNSPLNKTIISSTANSKLSDDDPNKYFSQLNELSYSDHFFQPSDIKDFFSKYSSDRSLEELIPLLDDVFLKRFNAIKLRLLNLLRDLEEQF